jgi:Fic family protein
MYTWQHEDWPNYTYNRSILKESLDTYAEQSARLLKIRNETPEDIQQLITAETIINESFDTSEIEGEILDHNLLRSSVMMKLGLVPYFQVKPDGKEEGIAHMQISARASFKEPLTNELLHDLHSKALQAINNYSLFSQPIKIGEYRDTKIGIVSGQMGKEKVHYLAPPANRVPFEMDQFIQWFNDASVQNNITGIERAAITHLWFETIHPYDDGNGRLGRAIAEKAISQSEGQPTLIALSPAILSGRKGYETELSKASASLDINDYIKWFTETAINAQSISLNRIEEVIGQHSFWEAHNEHDLNARQVKTLNKMFEFDPRKFGMTASKYMSINSCSKATATRDLSDLRERGCVNIEGASKNIRYNIIFPESAPTHNLDFSQIDFDQTTLIKGQTETNKYTIKR